MIILRGKGEMTMRILDEMYNKVIEHYGKEHQLRKVIEELDELKNEIGIALINGTPNRRGVFKELADVMNVLAELIIIYQFSEEHLMEERINKMKRQMDRMDTEQ